MPISVQPWAAYQRDSALVENRGPSITTSVPDGSGSQPTARAAAAAVDRPTGQ
jgi:hypothetical protein